MRSSPRSESRCIPAAGAISSVFRILHRTKSKTDWHRASADQRDGRAERAELRRTRHETTARNRPRARPRDKAPTRGGNPEGETRFFRRLPAVSELRWHETREPEPVRAKKARGPLHNEACGWSRRLD